MADEVVANEDRPSRHDSIQRHTRAATRWPELLEEIRQVSGFEDFAAAPPVELLRRLRPDLADEFDFLRTVLDANPLERDQPTHESVVTCEPGDPTSSQVNLPPMDREALLAELDQLLRSATSVTGDRSQLLARGAVDMARMLGDRVGDDDVEAWHSIGLLHLARYQILPEGQDQQALHLALAAFARLMPGAPHLVPDPPLCQGRVGHAVGREI